MQEKTSQLSVVLCRIPLTYILGQEKEKPSLADTAYHATCLPSHYQIVQAAVEQILTVWDEEFVLHLFHLNGPLEKSWLVLGPESKQVLLKSKILITFKFMQNH